MSELQDVADHVVVIGRGRVLADASVDELIARASGDQVLVRTPAPAEAAGGAAARRHRATVIDRNTLSVSGLAAQQSRRSARRGAGSLLRGHRAAGNARGRLPPTHAAARPSSKPARTRRHDDDRHAHRRSDPTKEPQRASFVPALRSEWTKFRTVRGWLIGLVVAVALCVAFTFLVANGSHEGGCTGPPPPGAGPNSPGSNCHPGHPFVPTGPDGEAVADSYYFVEQPLTGNGTITAQVRSLTGVTSTQPDERRALASTVTRPGLAAWAKAGILLTPSTKQGSAYAAVMATGSHGIRWQYNYTHDSPGAARNDHAPRSPRWLRLTRNGDTLTGYDSTNGTTWTQIGATRLTGLPATVDVGLFVTSPVSFQDSSSGAPTRATATFDHVSIQRRTLRAPGRATASGPARRGLLPDPRTRQLPPLRQRLRRQRLR